MRQKMRWMRSAMPPKSKQWLDRVMTAFFLDSVPYQRCTQLFCFVSLPQESDTRRILQHALADGKCTAVPRCLPEHQMQFHCLSPELPLEEQLIVGTHGVLEPLELLPVVTPDPCARALCLVPGLAFDRKGGRLGYGAGYYDRFLAAYPRLLKIGYAASCYILDAVPMDVTDQKLDGIAAEFPLEVWNG